MPYDAHQNLAVANVLTAPSPAASGTSLVVGSGQGARFSATPFNATVWPSGVLPDPTNAEIVRVTAIVSDTLTIVRAQEGTSARTILAGDLIAETITAKTLTDIETAVDVVSNAVSVETSARAAAVNTVSQVVSVLAVSVAVISNALSNELSVRAAKDDVLSQGISVVSQAVSVETANRISADNALSNTISNVNSAHNALSNLVSDALSIGNAVSQQ